MCGEWRRLRQTKGHCGFNTSSFTWTLQLFVAGLSVGSAPVLFIGRGRHGRIRHQPDLTWICWWRQVTEEEVHLCRAVAAGHYFFFFRRCGGRQHRGEGAGGWHSAVNLGAMLGGGTFCSDTRRTPFPLLVADGLQWKGERGQAAAMYGGLATGPDLRLPSGCCVGPELIEGES